ncbi:hypothetical protein V2W45_1225075 [Cenococcum geophilum]
MENRTMVILQITLDLSYQLHKHTSQFRIQYTHSGTSFFNCRRWALRHIRSLVHRYQDVIVIACGGGITAVLPLLLYLVNCMRAERAITRRVRLVWMVRKAENMGWISEELAAASLALGEDSLTINVYVTDRTSLAGSTYSSMGATPVTVLVRRLCCVRKDLIGRVRLRKLGCSDSISGIRWLFRRYFVLVVAVG